MSAEKSKVVFTDFKREDFKRSDKPLVEEIIAQHFSSDDGGGGSMNFVTHEQFNEFKDHTVTRFDNIDEKLKNVEDNTKSTKGNVKWLIGITAGAGISMIVGFISIIITLIIQM